MGKFWGDYRGGVGKSGVLEHKSGDISLKRVKIEEKLLWGAYRNSATLFRRYHPRLPTATSSPRLGFATPPKTPIAIISGTGEATDFKFGRIFTGSIRTKADYKFWRKGSVGVVRDCPNFWAPPIILRTGKATNLKLG